MNHPTSTPLDPRFGVIIRRSFPPDTYPNLTRARAAQTISIHTGHPIDTTSKLVALAAASGSWVGRLSGVEVQIIEREEPRP